MRKLFTVMALALPAAASAATFDFTTLGANNTLLGGSVVVGGVTARAFQGDLNTGSKLWLRNEPNDHGLGVCSEGDACGTGGGDVNELDNSGTLEFIVLERPDGTHWTQLWVSSLDSGGTGGSKEGRLVWATALQNWPRERMRSISRSPTSAVRSRATSWRSLPRAGSTPTPST